MAVVKRLTRRIVAPLLEGSIPSSHPIIIRFLSLGRSQVGKARDFDSRIREFEPRRPNHSSSCMNVQGELLFCRGDHWSPADACGNGKPSGRIWNPPLRAGVYARHRPGNAAASPLSSLFLASAPLLCYSIGNYHTIKELYYERTGNSERGTGYFPR